MWRTTTENNERTKGWKMFQLSCVTCFVLMMCHTVPVIVTSLVEAWALFQAGEPWGGEVFVAVFMLLLAFPVLWVCKLYFAVGKVIDAERYGPVPKGAEDGVLGVSIGEIQDGNDTV